jgi:protein involved in polysaccharide export with SLBB domain
LVKRACIAWFLLAVSLAAAAQSDLSLLPQSQVSQTQGQSTGAVSPSGMGLGSVPLLLRPDPNTITNVSPEQEQIEAQREQARQKQAMQPSPVLGSEPNIEFQDFAASSLGMNLPIFGENLFDSVPSTFAPLDRVQVTPDYIVGPGDELVIRAWGQINIDVRKFVDPSGTIYIPRVGVVNVAGVRYENLLGHLDAEIGRVFKNYQLSVTLGSLRAIQVFMVGRAKRPGTYTISALSSLVDALFATGGPSKHGSLRRIQVKRDGKVVTTFDLYDLIVNGDKSKDVRLISGDVIYIPPVGPLVAIAGSVNTPSVFELKDQTSLGEVIDYAGGLTNTAAGGNVVVERIDEQRLRVAKQFPLNLEGMAQPLHDGDVVRFQRILSKFENAVTLRGNVAVPGRYPWHEGMRVQDLIPTRGFLVTDEYWKRQNQLAVDARNGDFRLSGVDLKNGVKRLSSEINWEYAVVQRMNPQDLTPHLVPFNLGKAIQGDSQQNVELHPNDILTIFSQNDIQVPISERAKFVHLEGEFNNPGVYDIEPGETLRHLIQRIGGFTAQAYLYGSDFTRESTRVAEQQRMDQYSGSLEQSVQRNGAAGASALDPTAAAEAKIQNEHDKAMVESMKGLRATGRIVLEVKPNAVNVEALPDVVLEDGDTMLVPFRPATVNVIGSVYNSNAFVYRPGKTVGDYLRLAGGATRSGDKGREFVIRADGSTISRQQHSTLFSGSFDSTKLMPGDSIVVPVKLDRGATLRALRDFSTIFGQVGLAAAGFSAVIP